MIPDPEVRSYVLEGWTIVYLKHVDLLLQLRSNGSAIHLRAENKHEPPKIENAPLVFAVLKEPRQCFIAWQPDQPVCQSIIWSAQTVMYSGPQRWIGARLWSTGLARLVHFDSVSLKHYVPAA